MSRPVKYVLIGLGAAAAVAVVAFVAFFAAFYVVGPRRVLADHRRFVAAHPVGSRLDDVASDPFVARATAVEIDGELAAGIGREPEAFAKIPAALRGKARGNLAITWTHTPPFGRVAVAFTFQNGAITEAKPSSLD